MAGPAQNPRPAVDITFVNWLIQLDPRDARYRIENLTVKEYRELLNLIDRELSNNEDYKISLINLKTATRRIATGD